MGHTVKRDDTKTLRWDLDRDLTTVDTARVIVAVTPGGTPVLDRDGTIDSPATDGIVSLTLATSDYGASKLEVGPQYLVEIETSPGPLTHPDTGYETLRVIQDLG